MDHLSAEDRKGFTSTHPNWQLAGETISRTFVFNDFVEAMGFVTKLALAAEAADHHPDIDIRWNKVTLALTTHSEKALTARDIDLAARADAFAG
jgi:4a-hydroxytetrahydrobiopterin dehydratase